LFTFCSVVSLLIGLGTAGMWVRSHFRMHGVHVSSGPFWFGVMTNENRIEFFGWDIREGGISASLIGMPPRVWTDYPVREGPEWRWWNLGFGRERGGMTPGYSYYIPYWFICAVAGILPVVWLRRRGRLREGHCPACHYDLTGNVSGVCPECGAAVAGKGEA